MQNFKTLNQDQNNYIAYHQYIPKEKNDFPTVIFLSGYASDMEGTKAVFLENLCMENKVPFIRFDYFGTGHSSGDFIDGSINIWKDNVLEVIKKLTKDNEKVLLVGSSMGGWLMLLAALEIKDQKHSLIGIAAAPDFTEDLMWNIFSKEMQDELMETGKVKLNTEYCNDPENPEEAENHYIVTKKLILSGRDNLLLNNSIINIDCKITLLHGSNDEDVPYKYSMDIADKVSSKNVETIISQNSQHRFSEARDLELLRKTLKNHIM